VTGRGIISMSDDPKVPGASTGETAGEYSAIAAGLIPLVGGPISNLAQKYIRNRQDKRLEEFLEKLSKDIEDIKDRLNNDFIKKDDAKSMFPDGWDEQKPYLRVTKQPGKTPASV